MPIIAIIGAGGKTTALTALAQACQDAAALVTTTTHIYPLSPQVCDACLTDPTPEALSKALNRPGIVCAGSAAQEGKLGILSPSALDAGCKKADMVLYEGDGAHRLPLKLHRPDEPVLLPGTTHCLVVAGLSALGKPVSEAVHRYAFFPAWAANPGERIGAEALLHCVLETIQAAKLPQHQIRIFFNQADACSDLPAAQEALSRLHALGFAAALGSLRQTPEDLYPLIMNEAP